MSNNPRKFPAVRNEGGMEQMAEKLRQDIVENEPLYHDDPDPDVLVDENPQAPNGVFGDHEDDFDIG